MHIYSWGDFMARCCNNTKAAGRITGNPLNGLCERVCVAVKKVFDGSERSFSGENFTLALNVEGPAPYTFIEARSSGNTAVSNLIVGETSGARTRVSFTAVVPITVIYTDASGASRAAASSISIPRELRLRLPSEAVTPYEIEVATGLYANLGTLNGNGVLTITVCARQIVRVTASVELLVPSYGYCEYPEYNDDATASCLGLLQPPVFPE